MIQKTKVKIYNLLRWSEQYTKTDMVYLTKGGFWLTLGQIVSLLSAFLLAVIFANLLSKETYGIYKYALSLSGVLTALTLTGMSTAVYQAVARGFEGTFKKSFWIQLRWGIIVFSTAMAGGLYYFVQKNNLLALIFIFIALTLPISTSANTYVAFLSGKKEFKKTTQYNIISILIYSGIIFITLLLTKNPLWLVLIYLISTTGTNLFFYLYSIKKFKPNKKDDPESISYGKHLSLINVLGIAANSLDGILLFHFLGSVPLAIYSFATAPVDQIKGLFKNVPTLATPKIALQTMEKTDAIIRKRFLQLLLIGALITIIYIILIPYFFKIFFPKYLNAIPFSQLFALNIIFIPINSLLSAVSNTKFIHMPKVWLYRLNIIDQIVLIGSLLLLTPIFGIAGTIASRIILSFSITKTFFYYWRKMLKFQKENPEQR